jgi:hypothetical protein
MCVVKSPAFQGLFERVYAYNAVFLLKNSFCVCWCLGFSSNNKQPRVWLSILWRVRFDVETPRRDAL